MRNEGIACGDLFFLPQNRYALCGFALCCRIEKAVRVLFLDTALIIILFGIFISAPLCTYSRTTRCINLPRAEEPQGSAMPIPHSSFLIPHLLQHLLQILTRIRPVASRYLLRRACADDSSAAVATLRS